MAGPSYSDVLVSLKGALEGLPPADCARVLGDLERLKAILWHRMMTASSGTTSEKQGSEGTLLTLPQVATRLAIPEGRAYELARQGTLPTVRVGKYVRVPLAEFETWVAQRTSLERRIDRASADFHSVLTRKKKSEKQKRPFTDASAQPGGSRRQNRGRAPSKVQANVHVDQPQPTTPCSTVTRVPVDTIGVCEEE